MDHTQYVRRVACGCMPRPHARTVIPMLALVVIALTSGCATTSNNGTWDRIVAGSYSSLKQESVWVPLAAAAVFAATSADDEVSEWARERHPLFHSKGSARSWSDWLSGGLFISALTTSVVQRDESWQPLATDLLVLSSAYAFSAGVKEIADRARPDLTNDLSFPSLHATSAFTAAQITARNVSALDLSNEHTVRAGLFTAASAAAWARVEAGKHFPSDVLVGAAIGNFFAGVGNAFLEQRKNVTMSFVPAADGALVKFQWRFD